MGAQRASAQKQSVESSDGFGVAVVREDGKWRCAPMRAASLNSLTADIAAEVLEKLDNDINEDDLDPDAPFEEGDLGLLADIGLPEAVLGVILDESDLYADEQLGRIAREMGFADELSAVLDRLDR